MPLLLLSAVREKALDYEVAVHRVLEMTGKRSEVSICDA
jgi:hypothetical protein